MTGLLHIYSPHTILGSHYDPLTHLQAPIKWWNMNENHFFSQLEGVVKCLDHRPTPLFFQMMNSFEVERAQWGNVLISLSFSIWKKWIFPTQCVCVQWLAYFEAEKCLLVMFIWDKTVLWVLRWNNNFTFIVYEHAQMGPITKPKGKNKHGERWYTSMQHWTGLHIFSWQDPLETFISANSSIAVAETTWRQALLNPK